MGSSVSHQLTRLLKGEVHDCHCYHRNQSGKNVFAAHGVDAKGKPVLLRPSVPRAKLLELIAALPPCLVGMEACSGAHHWAREFQRFGHTVRLMAPRFVVPYRLSGKRGKNDAADAAAICEALKDIKDRVFVTGP
jgi:transposase